MHHHLFASDRVVPLADGKRIAGARRRQRLKAEVGQETGGTGIERIGDDERAIALMEGTEDSSLIGLRDTHVVPPAGMPNVPSTTSANVRSSRRMNRFVWAMAKFSRDSGSDRSRFR